MTLIVNTKDTFRHRKKERSDYYEKYIKGWRQQACVACSGSGFYDHDENPNCDACSGSGVETHKVDLNAIHELIGQTLQYKPATGASDPRMHPETALSIYIKNSREVRYQYVDISPKARLKTHRKRAKLQYIYHPENERFEWAFIDKTPERFNDNITFYLSEFKPTAKD